ncbi:NAD(P)/FAD-dependent oxidoreductase [Thioclava kandeliae]|uniref:FAD-dependent oxidoreductase n=1 Tax=Thioclava kandeliae TaxID=3070818 RepID=A0ABV1SLX8_9RHOB
MEHQKHIVVIGGGIIGACTALELVERGHRVTILEPDQPGGPQAASYGNGAFISPASIIPMSVPGLWRKVPGYLFDRNGPLSIEPLSLPRLMPWLWRFLNAGRTQAKLRYTARALNALLQNGVARHQALAQKIGHADLIRQDGLLYVFPDRAAFEAETTTWSLRRELGVNCRELGHAELKELEPTLSDHYRFGVLVAEGGQCTDPGRYTASIIAYARKLGADYVTRRASGIVQEGGQVTGVRHEGGVLACDMAVVAAGIHSADIARSVGDKVPLEAERGYHIEVVDPNVTPSRPVMPSDGKMANTMVAGRLRASGQVELSSTEAPPNWHRADVLLGHLKATYPDLKVTEGALRRWQGNRPSTPDGLPVIGPSRRCSGLFHAFGHGHVGLNTAPATARLLGDLLENKRPEIDAAPYSISRFG